MELARKKEPVQRPMRPAWTIYRPEGTVCYIGGSDCLPAPLTREEETALFARMEAEPDAVRDTLVERNCGWLCISPASLKTRAWASRI